MARKWPLHSSSTFQRCLRRQDTMLLSLSPSSTVLFSCFFEAQLLSVTFQMAQRTQIQAFSHAAQIVKQACAVN
jgi:hypothetical protein